MGIHRHDAQIGGLNVMTPSIHPIFYVERIVSISLLIYFRLITDDGPLTSVPACTCSSLAVF